MRPANILTLRILWASILASTFLLLVVLAVLKAGHGSPSADPMLLPGLAVAAVTAAVASTLLPRVTLTQGLKRLALAVTPRPAGDRLFQDGPRRPNLFVDAADAQRRAFAVFQSASILGFALAETVALFGFAAVMLGFPIPWGAPFFVLSWCLLATKFPTEGPLIGTLRRLYDADPE
jgi:hypothetical protein